MVKVVMVVEVEELAVVLVVELLMVAAQEELVVVLLVAQSVAWSPLKGRCRERATETDACLPACHAVAAVTGYADPSLIE